MTFDRLRRWVHARPLAWDTPPERLHADDPAGPVDVVVPVYQAPDAFGRCLDALLAHTDLSIPGGHRLLLVLDGPQPRATEARLAAAGLPRPGVEILRQPERRGFVAAVNRGMSGGSQDVVLLNSDAIVGRGWLEKLRAAAYSAPEIATATPFSNSATICSLPRFIASNALPTGETIASFALRIEERSTRAYPRLPTGVGVCLFIKRRALREIGLFDERAFGLGYGEESEWCQRALKAGFRHVLDDATFVYHEGHQSFGPSRRERVAAAHRSLARLHPDYLATIAAFVRADPLAPVRERALAGLAPRRAVPTARARPTGPRKVVHLVHGWPPWSQAGTELYAAWLYRAQAAHREVAAYARIADPARIKGDALELLDGGGRVRLMVNNFTERDPRRRNALSDPTLERDFGRFLDEERPDLVHVHHLSGHAATLPRAAFARGLPVVYQVQDWWTVCARANLLDRERALCTGPGFGKCARCQPLTALPGAALWNRALHVERRRLLADALARADVRLAGSHFLADSLNAWLGDRAVEIEVVPYGVALADRPVPVTRRRRSPDEPLRFGFVGSVLPHKGLHLAAAAVAGFDPALARLEIWGDRAADPGYAAEVDRLGGRALVWRGRFAEEDRATVLAELDLLIVPSLGLESFGLAPHEAMAVGTPVLASRRGALAEIPLGRGEEPCGGFFDPDRPEELRRALESLVATPDTLDRWRRNLPPIGGLTEHAEAVEEIYARVLARRKR